MIIAQMRAAIRCSTRITLRITLAATLTAVTFFSVPNAAFAIGESSRMVASAARIAGNEARTRVVIDFAEEPEFEVHYLDSPERIVVDLPSTDFAFPAKDLEAAGLFRDVRFGTMDEGRARIVLTAKKPVRLAISEVQPNSEGNGVRLVLDAEITDKATFANLVKDQSWQPPSPVTTASVDGVVSGKSDRQAQFIIAVDAGHGGIDNGAQGGKTGTHEKDITLAFAKELTERLNKEPGIQAVLTRESDEFLALSERVQIARQKGANLLISLHADTLKQKGIRGATVYTISDRASDRMAAELAERENLSDELAGVAMPASQPEVADILLDLTRRETQAFSVTLAGNILASFEGQIGLINNPHRYAGFRVLQAPDIPSILLEMGFLSNPEDEKLLLDVEWRKKLADVMAKAVGKYHNQFVANGG
ncbi:MULTISPECIES: N-acetylmuramoyl-L-alanine amidase [unclassified Agrobacterium]|jgi:N-acetylmuramoyl-L-alanine amidase|uniref:N-acetylmuramoyl-L-alanine amidase n=1 Tax=unclassified Agrobacterium TaxID=2632611 RepID=UPI001FED778E|nr:MULTISPECIES: N-acetylmuramoyl-L-alanine amidase [unclassified Agrobacterium]MDO5895253.1 N-acetylmuramoyl-L-alanine amidase [Agrobacterium sp. Azo12]